MNSVRIFTSSVLAFSLFLSSAAPAWSANKPAPAPAKPQGKVYNINPKTLQDMIVRRNIPVLLGLNKLHQAKDNVAIARANLLPSLNLGMNITSGAGFAISAISFLMPFLLPSNWANLYQSKALLEAEKVSYHLMGLNQFASGYAIYATVVNDLELRKILVQQYEDLVKIRDWLTERRNTIGTVPQQDIDSADAQVKLAFAQLSQMDVLLLKEKSAIREMLSLDIKDTINFEPSHVPALDVEKLDVESVAKKFQAIAPENQQMVYLVAAAREARWSKEFSWLGGSNLSLTKQSGTNSWTGVQQSGSLHLGFDIVPNIKLTSDKIVEIQLNARQLMLQQVHLAEDTIGALAEAKKQLEAYRIARDELNSVYETELEKYMLGLSDFRTVLDAKLKVAPAASSVIRTELDIDTLRVTLHRALISDQFKGVPKCAVSQAAIDYDRKGFWRNIFNPHAGDLTIDQVCLPAR